MGAFCDFSSLSPLLETLSSTNPLLFSILMISWGVNEGISDMGFYRQVIFKHALFGRDWLAMLVEAFEI